MGQPSSASCSSQSRALLEKERKDYAFQRQFNEKPSITPGCPGFGLYYLHCHCMCGNNASQEQPFVGSQEGLCTEVVQAKLQHCDTASMSLWQ